MPPSIRLCTNTISNAKRFGLNRASFCETRQEQPFLDDLSTSLKSKLAFYLLLVFIALCPHASDDKVKIQVATFVPPKLLEQKTPIYPRTAFNNRREAWVFLHFMVSVEGKTTNINVIESLGGSIFETAAIRALQESEYAPATLDGEPISASRTQKYTFKFDHFPEVATPRFIKMQRRYQKHIAERDQTTAQGQLEEMQELAKNLYEFAWLGFAEFIYHQHWGTQEDQLQALKQAVAYESKPIYLPKDVFASALASKFMLEVQLQYFQNALSTYQKILKLDALTSELKSTLTTYSAKVLEIKENRTSFAKTDQFDKVGRWNYRLLWNTFALELSNPAANDLRLSCDRKSVTFDYDPNMKYEVPNASGDCTLFLEGTPHSSITLYQL